ncbi:MAG: RNB domain-containing ribonuclease [Eubacterium sp.]|nr:RNB domain-containing ribonuclease [Eubacterium sp.]
MSKKTDEMPVYDGVYMGTKQGFGFVRVEALDDDIFIPERETNGAMNGDTVRVILTRLRQNGRHKSEGEIDRVLKHSVSGLVGTFQRNKKTTFVMPDDRKLPDIYVPKGKTHGALDGQKVRVEIISYATEDKSPEGVVSEVLGYLSEPGVDVMSVIRGMELPEDFPNEVAKEAKKLPSSVSRADRKGRKDFRDRVTVTIDGFDTKDYDDAITLERTRSGYELGVHIADVSHYVREGSALDREAFERGTSIYLADRVIPMLPEKLSNGICSLNEGEDRLTLSCVMQLDAKGEVISHEIVEGVIRVNERMTYHDVSELVSLGKAAGMTSDKGLASRQIKKVAKAHSKEWESLFGKYKKRLQWYLLMDEVAMKLQRRRHKHGSIDFDMPECKIELDDKGRTVDVKPYDRNLATHIIEEFMLAANRTVAEEAFWLELPFLYRCHDEPEREKIKDLARITSYFGHTMKLGNDKVHPKVIRTLMDSIKGTPEEAFLTRLTLRAMMRAEYRTVCDGHFGLAAKYYTHFTSPIRRYPDLQIHRILKEYRHGGISPERMSRYSDKLAGVAKQCSERERRADEAEREVDKLKMVSYMEDHIGDVYDGVISGVTSWGIYVELPNTIEGMVRLSDMRDDRYDYEESEFRVVGHRSRKVYRLGQKVSVQVIRVDINMRTIDFMMYDKN